MADTYGVKVKLQYQTNKSDLRGQLQSLLDGATQNSPLTIKNFKVSSPGLRKALNAGFKEANTPLTLSNIKLNLSANALSDLQTQLDSKGLTLTIKEIKADQAVNNLRTQLVRMLSGLQISGVKDFLGGAEIAEQGKALDSYVGNLERLKTMRSAISKSGAQLMAFGNSNATAELQRALVLYRELNDQVSRGIEAKGNWDNIDGLQEELRTLTTLIATHKSYLDSLKQEATAREKNAAATNSANLRELQKMEAALEKINTKGFNLDVDQSKIDVLTEKYNRLYEAIQKAMKTPAMRNNGHSIQELNDGVRALEQYVNLLQAEASANTISLASGRQLITLRTQINNWLQKNTKATQANRTQLQEWATELSLGNVSTQRYQEIANGVKEIDLQTRQAGLSGKTFFETFKSGLEKFGGWSLVTRSLTMVYNTLKKMVTTVIELDSAMTGLRRVTDLSEAGYARFMNTAVATAKEIGASVKDTINATADFARLGYTVEEATQLATAALTYKNIGDGIEDIGTATESLISTMKAFGIEASNSMYVVDMFNDVGNKFAISSKGIGDALQRSAAALAEGGNTIQESIGLITAANEVIQDPDVIGTAMKTLTMYLRAAKTEAEDAGVATDGMASSVSELRDDLLKLTGQKVDIMIDDTTFKSTYQIMEDLAGIWKQLDDITRSNILNLIGGKRNANTFSALLNNFDTASEAMKAAMGAAGSATRENEEYLKSIEGRIVRLKASFEELSHSVVNSSLIKWFVEIIRHVTEFATLLSDIGVLIPAVFAGAGFKGIIQQLATVKQQFGNTIQDIFSMAANSDGSFDTDKIVKSLVDATASYTDIQKVQLAQLLQTSEGFKLLTAEQQRNLLQYTGLTRAVSASTTGFKAFGVSVKQAWAAMSLFEKASVIMAVISTVYTVISSVISAVAKSEEEAREKARSAADAAKDTVTQVSNSVSKYLDLSDALENGEITTESYQSSVYDLISALRQQGETVDGLIEKYGDLHGAMLLNARDAIKAKLPELSGGLSASFDELIDSHGWTNQSVMDRSPDGLVITITNGAGRDREKYGINYQDVVKALRESGLYVGSGTFLKDTKYGIVLEELDSVEEIIQRRDQIQKALESLNEIKGVRDLDFYKKLTSEFTGLNTLIDQYIADMNEWNEALASISLYEYLYQNGTPQNQAEFDALRRSLTETLVATGQIVSLTGDMESAAQGAVDAVVMQETWANSFVSTLLGIPPATNKVVSELSNTISVLQKAADILISAKNDMEQYGALSSETINDMANQLKAGEDILDYLITENGVLKLNEQAWKERANAIATESIAAWTEEKDALQAILDASKDGSEFSLPDGFADLGAVQSRVDLLNSVITLITGIGTEASNASGEVRTFADAISGVSAAADLLTNIANGENVLDLIQQAMHLAELMNNGQDWTQFISSFNAQGGIQWNTDAIRSVSDGLVSMITANSTLATQYPGLIEYIQNFARAAENSGDATSGASGHVKELSGVLGDLSSFNSFFKDVKSGKSGLDMLQSAAALVEQVNANGGQVKLLDLFSIDSNKKMIWDDNAVRTLGDAIYNNVMAMGAMTDATQADKDAIKQWAYELAEATVEAEDFSGALSNLSSFNSFFNDVKSGKSGLDMLQSAFALVEQVNAQGGSLNVWDLFSIDRNKKMVWDDNAVHTLGDAIYNNVMAMEAMTGATNADKAAIKAWAYELAEATIEAQDFSGAIGALSSFNQFFQSTQAGKSGFDMLQSAISLAEQAGANVWDLFSIRDGEMVWNYNAVMNLGDALYNAAINMDAFAGATDDQKMALKSWCTQAAEAAAEATNVETAVDRMKKAYAGIQTALSNIPSSGDLVEITYEAYNELIAADARYASAVHYQNGILTLNRDAYASVTQAVLEDTKAKAAAEIQAITASDRYIDLTSRIGDLTDAEQQQLDSLNAEIMGYSVLIYELENATSAYQRFINASTQTDSSRYSAAENARKVIEDTLNNAESEIFGKIGREQYIAAIDFLIDPDIEVGTDEFDAALATIDRYLEEGTAGVRNFYNDLVQHGFIDSNGILNASMTDMAATLGVSMEFLRSMFDELNMYQDEDHKVKIECDTGEVESEALSAEEQLAALQAAASSLNETLDVDHTVAINTDPANTSLGKVSNTLTGIINKLNSLSGRRVTTYVHTVTTSSTGDTGASSAGGTKSAAGGRTLVGELGMETVVDPNTGSWYTVGRGGAEFVDLPRGAIVFNADQTKRLFQMGRIGSRGEERGRAMVAGGLQNPTNPFFAMAAFGAAAVIPSIVTGVVDGLYDQANGAPTLPPETPDNNNDDSGDRRPTPPDPSKKIDEISKTFEEFTKYMDHLIRHQEHLYEVAENGLDFPGMEDSLTEQARIYREMMAEAQQTVQKMVAAGAKDTDEALQKVEESYWSAYSSLHDILDQINVLYVDALNDKIDGVQSGYETFSTMLDEMSKDGKISVDTFQELVANGLEYLNYLELVDGQYVINQEALEKMIASEKEQLAIEQALAYIAQIRQALSDDDPEKVANLVNLTNQISNNTWDLVYANAALLKTMGLTDDEYASVIHNIDMMKSLTGQVNTSLDDGSAAYESQQDALDKILDYTKQLIQYETEEKIKAIEDEIDAYEELVNLRKEALKTAKDEADYSNDIANRTKEIAALEARIAQLSLDDSRDAQAERVALEEELAKLQGDLADVQGDHAYDAQVAALDKDAEAYRESREKEIAELEASISSEEKLYQAALQRIDAGWDTLYGELIAWNIEAGNSLNSDITSNWDLALEAAKRYGSYVDAIVAHTGNPMTVSSLGVGTLPIYHDGGVVSVNGIKRNEVVAVLEDGEEVLTKKQRTGLYRIVDFAKELSNRLGTAIKEIALPFSPMTPALAGVDGVHGTVVSNQNSMHFSPEITVQITHNGDMSDSDARSYGRQIGNIAMKEMQNAFERRGISGVFGGNLRQ